MQQNTTTDLKRLSTPQLMKIVGVHDCKLAEMEPCVCMDIWDELRSRNGLTFSTII